MKANLRKQLRQRKRQLEERIDKNNGSCFESGIDCGKTKFELSEKQQAISCGGLGMITQVVRQTKLRHYLNLTAAVLKLHAPYDEADHILNIAFNILAGGSCLEHLEHRRTDEAYLDALGSRRIPDPTTAGDFCRRFGGAQIVQIMKGINCARRSVWKQQGEEFFDLATIDADGSMVETSGEKKKGIGLNYKRQWGYHPLIVSLAQTEELLYLANRSGNRASNHQAAEYLDLAIADCRKAGFRRIRLRGDTDFSQTKHLDRWSTDGVEFVFGYDAARKLVDIASELPKKSWKPLRRDRRQVAEEDRRATRANAKRQIVVDREYKNLELAKESYAEFEYKPVACTQAYRMVVIRKEIKCSRGQKRLFDDDEVRYFFFITNLPESEFDSREVIRQANQRCNQENTISQLQACHCLEAPLHDLSSNWAYMVFASLAWTLKQWSGMLIRVKGNKSHKKKQKSVRHKVIHMEFKTYQNAIIFHAAQIIRSARQTLFRLLSYRPSVDILLMLHDHINRPLLI